MGGVNGFGYGSSGDSLVGHRIHGVLVGALAEQTPVGSSVFALHGAADGRAAERVMGGAAREQGLGVAHCPAQRSPPMVRVREAVGQRGAGLPGGETGPPGR